MASDRKRRRRAGTPAPVTADGLQAAALRYLSRYASSSGNLRRVLWRRVRRAARHHDTDTDAAGAMIDTLIGKLEQTGLVDDAAYAEARARSLHLGGASRRRIAARLAQKAVAPDLIAAAIAALHDEVAPDLGPDGADLDLLAAIRYARRRRFGPYRDRRTRADRRDKDLAAMARAGFALDVARRVIDASDTVALEDCLTRPADGPN